MGFVAIYCPRTGREVSTGLECDRDAFQKLKPVVARMRCPACGSEHAWSKATARLVDQVAAAAVAAAPAPAIKGPPSTLPIRGRSAAAPKPAAPPNPVVPPPVPSAGTKRGRTFSIASRLLGQR